jgi:hypothetical protein
MLMALIPKARTIAGPEIDPSSLLMFYIELPGLNLGMWGIPFVMIIEERLLRRLGDKGLLADREYPVGGFGIEDFFWFSIVTKGQVAALSVVKAELERMALLSHTQIGNFDGTGFRTIYAMGSLRPFNECVIRAMNLMKRVGVIPPELFPSRPPQQENPGDENFPPSRI